VVDRVGVRAEEEVAEAKGRGNCQEGGGRCAGEGTVRVEEMAEQTAGTAEMAEKEVAMMAAIVLQVKGGIAEFKGKIIIFD